MRQDRLISSTMSTLLSRWWIILISTILLPGSFPFPITADATLPGSGSELASCKFTARTGANYSFREVAPRSKESNRCHYETVNIAKDWYIDALGFNHYQQNSNIPVTCGQTIPDSPNSPRRTEGKISSDEEITAVLPHTTVVATLGGQISLSPIDESNDVQAKEEDHNFPVSSVRTKQVSDLESTYAYPIPWKPNDGKRETGTEEGIIFTNLPETGVIKIYAISGELIKKYVFSPEDKGRWTWDGKTASGQKVVSGIYIYSIEGGKEHKTGKLIVIR